MLPVEFATYREADSDEALELESRCPQGDKFRLRFARPYFHRRAESFVRWTILTARAGARLVGAMGGAIKSVEWQGRPTKALFLFDARVDPSFRRGGVARTLANSLIEWAAPEAEIAYTYSVGDNVALAALAQTWIGAAASPGFALLVCPAFRAPAASPAVAAADPRDVHQTMLAMSPPFDLYCDPSAAFASDALVGSWAYAAGERRAGCSVWSNAAILSEVVERIPFGMRLAGGLLSSWPLNRWRWPHTPSPGERLRSWYLFDFHASDAVAASALMSRVVAEAVANGIDYCYVVHRPGEQWAAGLQRDFPKLFAPIIPYTILARWIAGEPLAVSHPYIDIRDI